MLLFHGEYIRLVQSIPIGISFVYRLTQKCLVSRVYVTIHVALFKYRVVKPSFASRPGEQCRNLSNVYNTSGRDISDIQTGIERESL